MAKQAELFDDEVQDEVQDEIQDEQVQDEQVQDEVEDSPAPAEAEGEAEEEIVSIRDVASQYGLNLSNYPDDESALKAIAAGLQQARQLQQEVQQLRQTQQLQQSHPEPAAEESSEPPKFWDPPEFNPNWVNLVSRDDNGQLVPDFANGGNPEVVAKLQKYLAFRQDQTEKFWQNPHAYFQDFIDHRVQEVAKNIVEERVGSVDQTLQAREILARHQGWLFGQDGQLTEQGQLFNELVSEAEQRGIRDMGEQEKYALQTMTRIAQAQKAATAGETGQQKKQEFLQSAAAQHAPQAAASTNKKADAAGQAAPQNGNSSLEDMIRANLKAAGITDEDLAKTH